MEIEAKGHNPRRHLYSVWDHMDMSGHLALDLAENAGLEEYYRFWVDNILLPGEAHRLKLQRRIEAVRDGLELRPFGNTPTEDEEVSDFATLSVNLRMLGKSSGLCGLCKDIPIRWLLESPRNGYTLFDDFQMLKKSAESCDFCRLILQSVRERWNVKYINILISPQFLVIETESSYYDAYYHLLRLCADPGSEAARAGVEPGFPILPEAGGELHFDLLRSWLRDCDVNHCDHSTISTAEHELPTRLLNVGDAQEPDRLHLCSTEGRLGKYVALSHCWGERQVLSTTRGTIESHYKAIDFNTLPKTFRDAVVVTWKLGIQYLWIDSLCIIQDDKDDWVREARSMEKVFGLAYCTIAATSAKDSTEGILVPRSPVKHFVRLVDQSQGTPFNVYACEFGGNFRHDLEDGVLNSRGWVLQERALSPRTIHFTATQIYWECGSVIRSETLIQMVRPKDLLSSSRFPMTVSGPPLEGAASVFENVFATYSKLSLTKPEDRPHAIAGLERKLMDFYNTESVHGIVCCCLGKSLLWQRSSNEMMKKISDVTKPNPSWSWMSYEGGIRYGNIPKANTTWNRDIKIIQPSGHTPNSQHRILAASALRILHCYRVERWLDSSCIKDEKGHPVGWIRFDNEDGVDIQRLRFIVIAQHKSNGWAGLGQETWKEFAGIPRNEEVELSNPCYVLVVAQDTSEPGYEVEICYRLGVAIIQRECLSSREPLHLVWVT
ncbi:hypothetical protein RRF57_009446 [Xylaria bambusicola]|uniref:Heterokaryon incompatibility domain-containing protein n=1 Tax=Xylaria bambusicola TaxID=326684 RepID=A0AAN7UQX7_9PEZI